MPELPEVETSCQGIRPYLEGQKIVDVIVRNPKLRWPIPADLSQILVGQTIQSIHRRAKYLLFQCDHGILIMHLGMSGSLRIVDKSAELGKHDHVDICVDNGTILRFTDPRRFGAILWTEQAIDQHNLFHHLGPEPLSTQFDSKYLLQKLSGRRISIKTAIMDGKIVVGVGNIYANEALFLAGIHPKTVAKNLTKSQSLQLVNTIQQVLKKAIAAGGTTLKDFRKSDGKPGYFAQQLQVYGRENEACLNCDSVIQHYKESQRATYYCPQCQIISCENEL